MLLTEESLSSCCSPAEDAEDAAADPEGVDADASAAPEGRAAASPAPSGTPPAWLDVTIPLRFMVEHSKLKFYQVCLPLSEPRSCHNMSPVPSLLQLQYGLSILLDLQPCAVPKWMLLCCAGRPKGWADGLC